MSTVITSGPGLDSSTSSVPSSPTKPVSPSRTVDKSEEPIDIDEAVEELEDPGEGLKRLAEAKARHEEDLRHHHYEPPKADKVQNDWQVAYVWAFISKFNQRDKIRKLECLEDFERCLTEPLANRPDDVLEGILIRFLSNLKPGLRNLDCTNIQSHLSNYISDMLLNSTEFTVWDRPWAPNEEARGGCCNTSKDRQELGRLRYPGEPLYERQERNPIRQAELKGGGLFELDWRERAKLLRQLVDWQLNHTEGIRAIINRPHTSSSKGKASVVNVEDLDILTEPIGMDRNKNRIWTFDASPRLYSSGNPFKRPCPLVALCSTRSELQELIDKYTKHGDLKPSKPKGSGPKGRSTAAETMAYRKLLKGIEDEKNLAERLNVELLPELEKEEARVNRARRRIQQALELAQIAESRSTRTRRPTRKVDYTYDDDDDFERPSRSSRRDVDYNENAESSSTNSRGKAYIPGERSSARVRGRAASPVPETVKYSVDRDDSASHSRQATPSLQGDAAENVNGGGEGGGKKRKSNKGYAWVEEFVPFDQLSPAEQSKALEKSQEDMSKVEGIERGNGDVNGGANVPDIDGVGGLDDAGATGMVGVSGNPQSSPASVIRVSETRVSDVQGQETNGNGEDGNDPMDIDESGEE